MKQVPIKLGPVALLLTVITICLTVMAILTLSTAGADKTMAANFADSTRIRYTLEAEGQKFLKEADEVLAAGGKLTDLPKTEDYEGGPAGSVERIFEDQGYHLTIRLEPVGAEGVAAGNAANADGAAANAANTGDAAANAANAGGAAAGNAANADGAAAGAANTGGAAANAANAGGAAAANAANADGAAAGNADGASAGAAGYRVVAWSLEKTWEQNQEIHVWQP